MPPSVLAGHTVALFFTSHVAADQEFASAAAQHL